MQALLRAVSRPNVHPYIREAVIAAAAEQFTLRGACDRNTLKEALRRVSGVASANHYEVTYWDFLSPAQSALPVSELMALFAEDILRTPRRFEHSAIAGIEPWAMHQGLPFYSAFVPTSGHFASEGFERDRPRSPYNLVMHSDGGEPAGYLRFSLKLEPGERDLDCLEPEHSAAGVRLLVQMHDLYVLRKHRKRGAANAACNAIAETVVKEVEHIAEQASAVALSLDVPYALEVVLENSLDSQVAAVIDDTLLSSISAELEWAFEGRNANSFAALRLRAVASDSDW